jgi:hypothetical protein
LTTGSSWTIPATDVKIGGASVFNLTEDSKAYFNFNSDSILLPSVTYNKTIIALQKAIPGLVCAANANCVYNDVCSNLEGKNIALSLSFDGINYYNIPVQDEVVDAQSTSTCVFNIGK